MAEDVGRTGERVRSGAGIEWVGVAAERYRQRLADHGRDVANAQDEMLQAARALDVLADELEARQAAIRRAMQFVEDRVAEARQVVNRLGDFADDVLTVAERSTRDAASAVLSVAGRGLPNPGAPGWSDVAQHIGRLW